MGFIGKARDHAAMHAPDSVDGEFDDHGAMQPEVSVIVVNWNTRDLLHDCLRSIADQTQRSHEVIVVDNASKDGSADMVRAEFPGVTLIANDQNRGFAAANNQGLRAAKARYVLLLNPDTVILDGAIDTMIAWCDEHPDVGCAGCQVFQTETTIQRTCFSDQGPLSLLVIALGLHGTFGRQILGGYPEYGLWDRCSERDVDVVSGMFMLVPRHVMEKVGLLDEAFFVYSEEVDWCRRIRDAGYRCVFTPVARIIHRDGGRKSTSQIRPRMYVQQQKSKLIYIRKHYGRSGHAAGRAILLTSMLGRWALMRLASLVTPDKEISARANLAWAAARFHLTGIEPG